MSTCRRSSRLGGRRASKGEDAPSVNDFVVKAAAATLREFPRFNASYVDGKVERYSRVNVGIAVATDDALLVPVVRDADLKSLAELAKETRTLADGARRRTLRPEDFHDGTFTVSNLGMFGVRAFTAIIDPPQVAILAVGGARRAPVEEGADRIAFRDVLTVTLSCDHRVVYGADGARFLSRLRELLERPLALLSDRTMSRHRRLPHRHPRCARRGARGRRARDPLRRGRRRRRGGLRHDHGPLRQVRPGARVRHAHLRAGARGRGVRIGGARPSTGHRDHVRRLPHARDGQPRQPVDEVLVPDAGAGQRAAHDPFRRRRRGPIRRDPLADAGVVVHGRARAQDRRPIEPRRREGPAQGGDTRRQPRALLRAQASLRARGRGERDAGPARRGGGRPGRARRHARHRDEGSSRRSRGRGRARGGRRVGRSRRPAHAAGRSTSKPSSPPSGRRAGSSSWKRGR